MKNSLDKLKDGKITEKILDLNLINNIKKSNIHINYLNAKLKLYENQIQILKENKPYSFRKNKLKKYYNELNEYEEKIKIIYKEIENEIKLISQIHENLK